VNDQRDAQILIYVFISIFLYICICGGYTKITREIHKTQTSFITIHIY